MLLSIHRWLHWGVTQQSDWTLKRKVLHTNIAALVAIVSIAIYDGILMALGSGVMIRIFLAEVPFYAILASIPWLNAQGRGNVARWTLAFSAIASQLIAITFGFGSYLNGHFYFLLFALVPVVFFPLKQWLAVLFLFLLNISLYLYFEYVGYAPDPEVMGLHPKVIGFLRGFYIATATATMLAFVWMVELIAERNETKLEKISMTDALTGLPNRRHFSASFDQELAKSRRSQTAMSMIMLDIDRFKQINDRYGHDMGDQVLQHVAKLLRSATRLGNVIARVGGEEFAVLLPATPVAEAVDVAERMRQTIESNQFLHGDEPLAVTVSAGVAAVDYAQSFAHTYKLADTALYRAKESGRNRVTAFRE